MARKYVFFPPTNVSVQVVIMNLDSFFFSHNTVSPHLTVWVTGGVSFVSVGGELDKKESWWRGDCPWWSFPHNLGHLRGISKTDSGFPTIITKKRHVWLIRNSKLSIGVCEGEVGKQTERSVNWLPLVWFDKCQKLETPHFAMNKVVIPWLSLVYVFVFLSKSGSHFRAQQIN